MQRILVLGLFTVLVLAPRITFGQWFVRGDANGDSTIDQADPIFILSFLFNFGDTLCSDAEDANDDGVIDIADPVFLLSYLFFEGPAPADPDLTCGPDPTTDSLGCANPPLACIIPIEALRFPGQRFDLGGGSSFLSRGDVDGDGDTDVVALADGGFRVFLNPSGPGTGETVPYTCGGNLGIELADLNADGHLDVVSLLDQPFSTNVGTVCLGVGDGSFGPPLFIVGNDNPRQARFGDFTGDLVTDLIVISGGTPSTLQVRPGFGDGTFGPPIPTPIPGSNVRSFDLALLNFDALPDVVVLTNTSIYRALGQGVSFDFANAIAFGTFNLEEDLRLSDLDGDGSIDLFGRGQDSIGPFIGFLSGVPIGTFGGTPTRSYLDHHHNSSDIGDLNGDGNLDLVTGSPGIRGFSSILGDGTGSFSSAAAVPSGMRVEDVALADWNGDGTLDVLTANDVIGFAIGRGTINLGRGDGTFESPIVTPVAETKNSVATGEFTGDAIGDVALSDLFNDTIQILGGFGDGTFTIVEEISTGDAPRSLVVRDFDGDGDQDLACVSAGDGLVQFFLNSPGGFVEQAPLAVGGFPSRARFVDLNGDGLEDCIVSFNAACGGIQVALGTGDTGFGPVASFPVFCFPGDFDVADVNGDGHLDVVTAENFATSVLLGDGTGAFGPAITVSVAEQPVACGLGDFDKDGDPDLALGWEISNIAGVDVLWNDGDGNFSVGPRLFTGHEIRELDSQDYNGDGHVDLAVAMDLGIVLLLGLGDGTFAAPKEYFAGSPTSIATGDLDGDGAFDFVATSETEEVYVLPQQSP